MNTADVLVFGASRGIGLEFVKQYLAEGRSVWATYRGEAVPDTLKLNHPKLSLYNLDITDEQGVLQFADTFASVKTIILSAGVKGYQGRGLTPLQHTSEQVKTAYEVNVLAHDNIMRAFAPKLLVAPDSIAVYMGSKVGQTSDNQGGGSHPYRMSKAAGHMMIRNWDIALRKEWKGTQDNTPCAVAVCAGWVRTDMGGQDANLSVEESVSRMRKVIEEVVKTKDSHGLFMHDGSKSEQYPVLKI
jgi:NAD(P)-dependent dehydrogenase (short-subunit alcohol dehydrogenase family)